MVLRLASHDRDTMILLHIASCDDFGKGSCPRVGFNGRWDLPKVAS
jgi:hypothetical protein